MIGNTEPNKTNTIISISDSGNANSSLLNSVDILTESKCTSQIPSPLKVPKKQQSIEPEPWILNLSSKSNSIQEGFESQSNSQNQEFEQESYLVVQEQISNIEFISNQKTQILYQLSQINNWYNIIKKYNMINKKKEIDRFYQSLLIIVYERKNSVSKIGNISKFFGKNDDNLIKLELKMQEFVKEFYFSLSNFMESGNQITVSQTVNHAGIIQDDSICIPITFTLCSRELQLPHPIESEILLTCNNNKFVKLFFEQQLLQTIKEKLEKFTTFDGVNKHTQHQSISSKDKSYWMDKLKQQINKKNKSVFLNVEFDRKNKILIIHPQKERPFIITHTNCPIYLASNQTLQFENNLQIIVKGMTLDFTADSVNKLKVIQQNNQQEQEISRTIKNSKLEFINLQLIKDRQTNQFTKSYEFYLKSNEINLKNQMLGIEGILKNDMKGFTLVPPENQQYKLYCADALQTKSKILKFSLEMNNDFWITIDYDLKKIKLFD